MTINERFGEILKYKKVSIKQAANLMGKTEVYIRKLLRAGESFGMEPFKIILNSFHDINGEWLLTGEGEMIKPSEETRSINLPEVPEIGEKNADMVSSLLLLIKEQTRTIQEMASNKDSRYLIEQNEIKDRITNLQKTLQEQNIQVEDLCKKLDEFITENRSTSKNVG